MYLLIRIYQHKGDELTRFKLKRKDLVRSQNDSGIE